jgi:hypothetical protein
MTGTDAKTGEIDNSNQRRVELRALGQGRLWCAACARDTSAVTIEQASSLTNLPAELLLIQITNRTLHHRIGSNGSLLICLESLVRFSTAIAAGRTVPLEFPYLRMR